MVERALGVDPPSLRFGGHAVVIINRLPLKIGTHKFKV